MKIRIITLLAATLYCNLYFTCVQLEFKLLSVKQKLNVPFHLNMHLIDTGQIKVTFLLVSHWRKMLHKPKSFCACTAYPPQYKQEKTQWSQSSVYTVLKSYSDLAKEHPPTIQCPVWLTHWFKNHRALASMQCAIKRLCFPIMWSSYNAPHAKVYWVFH